ncbi:MAG: alpha/beta hydrolase, partial [Acidimicrobiia bacterium]
MLRRTVAFTSTLVLTFTLALVLVGPGATLAAGVKGGPTPYAVSGPYAAGVTTLDMDGTPVEVWYPVAPSTVGDTPEDVYYVKESLPPAVQSIIPASVNPPFTQDAYRDLAPSPRGPFPLVLFSHGFAGFRLQSTFLTTHLAQWGFVVASPEFETRNLASVLGAKPTNPMTDSQVLAATTRALREQSATAGSLLDGTVKSGKVAVTGHSAGGFAAVQFGARPN